jgi:hypothetical protein
MAVVVFPTPPFWLTTASTFEGAFAAGVAIAFEVAERVDTGVFRSLSGACPDGKLTRLCRSLLSCGESCGRPSKGAKTLGMWMLQCGKLFLNVPRGTFLRFAARRLRLRLFHVEHSQIGGHWVPEPTHSKIAKLFHVEQFRCQRWAMRIWLSLDLGSGIVEARWKCWFSAG